MRSSITTRRRAAGAGVGSMMGSAAGRRFGRHQVAELPPISVMVTEHRTHQLRCRHCRARTSARLPDADRRVSVWAEVAGGGRDVDRPASDLPQGDRGARPRSVRRLALDRQRGRDLPARVRRARWAALPVADWVLDQGAVHVDETGWRTRGEGRACGRTTRPRGVSKEPCKADRKDSSCLRLHNAGSIKKKMFCLSARSEAISNP